jgi:hypothetical protein
LDKLNKQKLVKKEKNNKRKISPSPLSGTREIFLVAVVSSKPVAPQIILDRGMIVTPVLFTK